MINRAFIYTPSKYPRGGANANYVQYLGAALSYAGYKTYIIAIPNVSDTTLESQKGIEFLPLSELNSKIFNHYFERIGCWAEIKEYLTKFHAGETGVSCYWNFCFMLVELLFSPTGTKVLTG